MQTLFIAATSCSGFLAPTQAAAGLIGINGTILTATIDSTADQVLVGTTTGSDLTLLGAIFDIVTPGCVDQGAIVCSLLGLTEVRILMGSGDDVVDLTGIGNFPNLLFSVLGGDGNDILIAPYSANYMWGGAGDDVLLGNGTSSCLSGGTGDNIVIDSSCNPGAEPTFPPPQPVAVAEPSSSLLLIAGLVGLGLVTRRRVARLVHA